MEAHGIYALLDMHEDVLSSKFCLYDGAPRWVIDKSVPDHAFPWPLKGNCSSRGWMTNELSEASCTAFQGDWYLCLP
jgi:endoglycosylceramidase